MKPTFNKLVLTAAAAILLISCGKEDEFPSISYDDLTKGIEVITGIDGKEYEVVDLGLPSKALWATCNMGASSPDKSGTYFAWGETQGKSSYDWTNYKHRVGDGNEPFDFTKYVQEASKGLGKKTDGKTRLDSIDNAPKALMGNKWHTPTSTEVAELLLRTSHTLCTLNGVKGYKFTSTEKGYEDRSIFMPLTGKIDITNNYFIGDYGFYWIDQLYASRTDMAQVLWMDNKDGFENVAKQYLDRCVGLPIRPVAKK